MNVYNDVRKLMIGYGVAGVLFAIKENLEQDFEFAYKESDAQALAKSVGVIRQAIAHLPKYKGIK